MLHVMDRRAADNKYLHRDFHISNDLGAAYIAEKYGPEGVDEYLRTFDRRKICVSRFQIVNSPTSPFFFAVESK